jgi:hypothetical protein
LYRPKAGIPIWENINSRENSQTALPKKDIRSIKANQRMQGKKP